MDHSEVTLFIEPQKSTTSYLFLRIAQNLQQLSRNGAATTADNIHGDNRRVRIKDIADIGFYNGGPAA